MGASAGDIDGATTIEGGTDATKIGNIGDRLKVNALSSISGDGSGFVFSEKATSSTALVLVEKNVYTEQTSNAQRSIASSSANDTAAGTGARTVTITYLDSSGNGPYTDTVTLNGTSYVNTAATNICFIESIIVATAGSTDANVGTITLKAGTGGGGATIWTVSATDNRTFAARHYVPSGKTALVTGLSCSHSGTTVGSGGVFYIAAKPLAVSSAAEIQVSDFVRLYGQSSTFSRNYTSPIRVIGPHVLRVFLKPETSSSVTYRASFDYSEPI